MRGRRQVILRRGTLVSRGVLVLACLGPLTAGPATAAFGNPLVTRRDGNDGLTADLRRVDSSAATPVPVLGRGRLVNATQLSTDPLGNGAVITTTLANRQGRVVAVPYSAGPPGTTDLALTARVIVRARDAGPRTRTVARTARALRHRAKG